MKQLLFKKDLYNEGLAQPIICAYKNLCYNVIAETLDMYIFDSECLQPVGIDKREEENFFSVIDI